MKTKITHDRNENFKIDESKVLKINGKQNGYAIMWSIYCMYNIKCDMCFI